MSITVIYNGMKAKRRLSIISSNVIFINTFITPLLMTRFWLLQIYCLQFAQYKISLIHEEDLLKKQHLRTIQLQVIHKIDVLGSQSNLQNSFIEYIVENSKVPKEEFDFDINQNISLSKLYPSVLKANSKLLSLNEKVELLSNQQQNT